MSKIRDVFGKIQKSFYNILKIFHFSEVLFKKFPRKCAKLFYNISEFLRVFQGWDVVKSKKFDSYSELLLWI